MLMTASAHPGWLDAASLKGCIAYGASLKKLSWFRTGGMADMLFEPAGQAELMAFLAAMPADLDLTIIGGGSNMLVRDGGIGGVVIHLGQGFEDIRIDGNSLAAGAAAMDVHIARYAQKAGLSGLEFLVGIPGTLGGAMAMNAGAYGRDMTDILLSAEGVDRSGAAVSLSVDDFGYAYRSSALGQDIVLTGGILRGEAKAPDAIAARMKQIMQDRADNQPIGTRTGGSTFKNPEGHKAWQLVDQAGCRGRQLGGAQISQKHCNFMINLGGASATDLEQLGEDVRAAVREATGVSLEWEIKRVGRKELAR